MLATDAPIDSLVREMKRGRSYTLGLGRATPLSEDFSANWPIRVSGSLRAKTQRNTLLIETDAIHAHSEFHRLDSTVRRIVWTIGSDPSPSSPAETRQAMKDLGTFPQWKEEYPLIVLHLGSVGSAAFELLGKLCDGIALAADLTRSPTASLRDLSQRLRHHQAHGCRILGMWSVEIG